METWSGQRTSGWPGSKQELGVQLEVVQNRDEAATSESKEDGIDVRRVEVEVDHVGEVHGDVGMEKRTLVVYW